MDTAVTIEAVYHFGPFRLEPAERLLLRDGKPVALTPKAFDLLVYLVSRPGRLVKKGALIAALWGDTIVEEANLASTVSALRRALDDDGQHFVATVPTSGYRFVAAVRVEAATPPSPQRPNGGIVAPDVRRWPTIVAVAICSLVMFAAGWLSSWHVMRARPDALSVQVSIEPAEGIRGPDVLFERWAGRNRPSRTSIALSPDGRHLVFAGLRGDLYQLWVRPLASDVATPIAGTEDGAAPFFSPDGRWVGYWARRALWKVPLDGGVPVKICDALMPFGASWGSDDRIVFADHQSGGLLRVAAPGGVPETLTRLNVPNGEGTHRLPFVLPGAKAVLFTILSMPVTPRAGQTHIALRSLVSGEQRVLIRNAADARYAPSGHLIYMSNGTLTAVPFDLRTLQLTGSPVGIIDGVMQANYGGTSTLITMSGQFALSQTGSLAWIPAAVDPNPELFRKLVWVDRHGNASPIDAPPDAYYCPRLSPDGQRIVVQTAESTRAVWIYDTRQKTRTRLQFDGPAHFPQWTIDGTRITFAGAQTGMTNLFWIPADGSGPASRLTTHESQQVPAGWTPDGKTLVFVQCEAPSEGCDIWALSPGLKGAKPWIVVQTPADDFNPALSPDGRWLAYVSRQSGRAEVYVQAFPTASARHQISTGGGDGAAWSRDGRTLYYYGLAQGYPGTSHSGHIYFAVDISTSREFSASAPRRLFDDPERKYVVTTPISSFETGPDGRFLMVEVKRGPGVVPPAPKDVRLVINWASRLH
jgi:eukaryotic-like serine/threonine-protein kinase